MCYDIGTNTVLNFQDNLKMMHQAFDWYIISFCFVSNILDNFFKIILAVLSGEIAAYSNILRSSVCTIVE